jgi:hypothetical protein
MSTPTGQVAGPAMVHTRPSTTWRSTIEAAWPNRENISWKKCGRPRVPPRSHRDFQGERLVLTNLQRHLALRISLREKDCKKTPYAHFYQTQRMVGNVEMYTKIWWTGSKCKYTPLEHSWTASVRKQWRGEETSINGNTMGCINTRCILRRKYTDTLLIRHGKRTP